MNVRITSGGHASVVERPNNASARQPRNTASATQSAVFSGIPYDGPYEATPSLDTQTFSMQSKLMTADFTVAPIPTNYGLVTYNGTTIHIS